MSAQEIAISNTNDYTEFMRGNKTMARSVNKTSNIYVRIDPETKKEAETVLNKVGLTMSQAITLFIKQLIIHNGIPFEISGAPKHLQLDEMSRNKIITKLHEGSDDFSKGDYTQIEEFEKEMKDKYGS